MDLHDAIHKAANESCGLVRRDNRHWISPDSLRLLDMRRTIPPDSCHDDERRALTRKIKASLRKDRECWWAEQASEIEAAASAGNSQKLFRLIRSTGCKSKFVSESISEADGRPIFNLERRLER